MMYISNHLAHATSRRLVTWLLISCLCMSSCESNDGDILKEMERAGKDYEARPNVQTMIDLVSDSTSSFSATLNSGKLACARVITLLDSFENFFTITEETNFCSTFFKTQSRSKLTFDVSVLNLYPCHEEYLIINDGATIDSTLCDGNASVSSRSSRFLFVQYRRITRTGTAFNITVKAVPNVATAEMANMTSVLQKSFSEGQICSGCGHVNRNVRQPRILGGSVARVTDYPWMVGVHVNRKRMDPTESVSIGSHCGASILDRRHVLSAAHCVQAESTFEYPLVAELYVVVGSDLGFGPQKSDSNAQKIKVAHWYTHPSYSPDIEDRKSFDIAVLYLEQELQFNDRVGPVCLAAPLEFLNSDVTVTGYGHDPKEGTFGRTLQSAKLTVRHADECINFYRRAHPNFDLKSHQVCLYSPSMDACGGDSGGPAVLKWENLYYQVGVVSFGTGCNDNAKARLGGYTRVSSFIPWIKTVFHGIFRC